MATKGERIYTISVGKNAYQGPRIYIDNCIKAAKDSIKLISKLGIVAVEKDRKIIMLKETFDNKSNYFKAIQGYRSKGFKVHMVNEN